MFQVRDAEISVSKICKSALLKEAEFSRGIINQNIEYRNSVMERQLPVCQAITKLYRLIALYQGMAAPKTTILKQSNNQKNEKGLKKQLLVDVMDLNIILSPPMYLNMTTIQEIFSNVEPVIEQYIKYYYGENLDDDVTKIKVQKARKELIKLFATQIDFNTIEEILKNLDNNNDEDIASVAKTKIANKGIQSLTEGDSGPSF